MQVVLPLLIYTFGPVSGAHFNPMVTATFVATKALVTFQLTTKPVNSGSLATGKSLNRHLLYDLTGPAFAIL